ncbi:MAG: hypothetical protein EBZ51_13165 [Synechococcaceae bacterium WB9_2_112]|nr:hypothetical protein [Synechococcaceae bacterium WB9_2_112]
MKYRPCVAPPVVVKVIVRRWRQRILQLLVNGVKDVFKVLQAVNTAAGCFRHLAQHTVRCWAGAISVAGCASRCDVFRDARDAKDPRSLVEDVLTQPTGHARQVHPGIPLQLLQQLA